jgi:hypothetical protein
MLVHVGACWKGSQPIRILKILEQINRVDFLYVGVSHDDIEVVRESMKDISVMSSVLVWNPRTTTIVTCTSQDLTLD